MKKWQANKLDSLTSEAQKVHHVINTQTDLACVLIGTSYLAELLASILSERFIESSVANTILNPQSGALGDFGSRTDLAYLLGCISKQDHADIRKLAQIRNQFAHNYLSMDFGDANVQKLCDDLHSWRILDQFPGERSEGTLTDEQRRTVARNQFNMSVVFLVMRLHLDALGHRQEREQSNSAAGTDPAQATEDGSEPDHDVGSDGTVAP